MALVAPALLEPVQCCSFSDAGSANLYASLSPVYTEIDCDFGTGVKFEELSLASGLGVVLSLEAECHNPNPYLITIESSKPGEVFMGPSRSKVGQIDDIATVTLPAEGTGTLVARKQLNMFSLLLQLGSLLVSGQGEVPIELEMHLDVVVDIGLIFFRWKTVESVDQDCGVHLAGSTPGSNPLLDLTSAQVGSLACADSHTDLVIPPAHGPDSGSTAAFAGVGGIDLESATASKNLGIGTAIAVAFSLSLILLFLAAYCWYRLTKTPHVKALNKGGQDNTVDASVVGATDK